MPAGLEQIRPLPQYLGFLITGNGDKGAVDVDDQAVLVGDQHALAGAIEHRGGLAQALAVLGPGLQVRGGLAETLVTGMDQENQHGADAHPQVTANDLPLHQLLGVIEKAAQQALAELDPEDR